LVILKRITTEAESRAVRDTPEPPEASRSLAKRTVHAGGSWRVAAHGGTAGAADLRVGAADRAAVRKKHLRGATRASAAFALAVGAVEGLGFGCTVRDAVAAAERGAKEITRATAAFAQAGGAVEGLVRWAVRDAVAAAERGVYRTSAFAEGEVEKLTWRTDIGYALAAAERGATRAAALAHPTHALLPLITAVEAAPTVPFISLQVDTVAVAAGLVRSTTLCAAATVILVGL
jgi:hypothetical protein